MVKQDRRVDVLFVDLARKGRDAKFLEAVVALKPLRIVYISCKPSTLVKDAPF
jgi:tRNA/tmRNA/rRNA uracil-C5-methylase (TrmA/RlmC/RlmD family)